MNAKRDPGKQPGVGEDLARAVSLLEAGDWEQAHAIAQRHEGDPIADWIHAVVHRLEGDESNSRFWYHHAGRSPRADGDLAEELRAIRSTIELTRP